MRTQEAFTISILECANRIGLKFKRNYNNSQNQREHIFYCPLRKDKNPSIYINEVKNVWYDNGGIIDGGGIISFINYLYQKPLNDTSSALRILDGIYPELKYPSKKIRNKIPRSHIKKIESYYQNYGKKEESESSLALISVKNLFSYPLKDYLQHIRRINLSIAVNFVKEIKYKHKPTDKVFYAIGFKSGSTWAVRSKLFKGFISSGCSVTTFDLKTDEVLLFEGFIDFLTYLTIKGSSNLNCSVIVMNSASFVQHAIKWIESRSKIKKIVYFRDNDQAGLKTLDIIKNNLNNVSVIDQSDKYKPYKDLNEAYIKCKNLNL